MRRLFLCEAVDKHGRSVGSYLTADRGIGAAREFFRKAVALHPRQWPRKVNLDGNAATRIALHELRNENPRWRTVVIRTCRHLNNIIEQDHRAIKRRCASMLSLKSFQTAAVTLSGIELAHRVRKQQFSFGRGRPRKFSSLKELWAHALA